MRSLQVRIELVPGVTRAVVGQAAQRTVLLVAAHPLAEAALVDVVTEMQHEIVVARGKVAVCGEPAVFVVLA